MFLRSFISLTLSALLLSSVSQVAFASGRGGDAYLHTLENEKKSKSSWSFIRCICGDKKNELIPATITSNSNSVTVNQESEQGNEAKKNATSPYVFNLNFPPQTTNIQAFEKQWIPHFLANENAIDPKGLYPLLLRPDDIQNLFQTPKAKGKDNRQYTAIGQELEGSFRTNIIDSAWNKIFRDNTKFLYAVYAGAEYRDQTTNQSTGVIKKKGGTLVKYAVFQLKNGNVTAINQPEEEKILTFTVSYRERDK